MMCNRCGNRNPLNSKFCRFCGVKLDEPGASKPLPEEEFYVPVENPADRERVQRLLDEAFAQSEKGDVGAAIRACKEALVIDPRSVSAHSLLGLLYERVGEKERAIAEYERVLQLNPDSALERESLARLRGEQELAAASETARPSYRPFPYVETMPIVFAATVGILMILFAYRATSQSNRPTRAERDKLTVSVAADALRPTHTEQGQQALLRRDYFTAEREFTEALRANPNDPQAQEGLQQARRGMMLAVNPPMSAPVPQPTPTQTPTPAPTTTPVNNRPTTPTAAGTMPAPLPPLLPTAPLPVTSRPGGQPPSDNVYVGLPSLPRQQMPLGRRSWEDSPAPPVPQRPPVKPPVLPPGNGANSGSGSGSGGGGSSSGSISIRQSPGTSATPSPQPVEMHEETGFDHQQNGMVFYRSGKYAEAIQEFQRAIAAYQEQQRKGVNPEEAADGIQTCQNYVKLCQVKLGR